MRITKDILVERPPPAVWAVLIDLESHPRWRPALREFRQVTDGPLAVGARIREVLVWRGREIVLDDEVTALEPGRLLGIRGGWKAADFELEFRLAPEGTNTSATFDWTLEPRSSLMRIAAPFLRGTMQRSTAEELQGLKREAESRPAPTAGHASLG